MTANTQKIIFAVIIILLVGISVAIIFLSQSRISERPSLAETRLIRSSVEDFTKAKDLQERLHYVTKASKVQEKMRTYLVVPFSNRRILEQKIMISEFSYDPESDKRTATAEQELTYFSEADAKTHQLHTTFKLERLGKQKRWLISDFLTIVKTVK